MSQNESVETFGGMTCYPSPVEFKDEDKLWALACHLSCTLFYFTGFSFLIPLIIWIVKKDESPFLRKHALEAMSFTATYFGVQMILFGIGLVLMCVGIGLLVFLLMLPVFLAFVVWSIIGAIKAYDGKIVEYPVSSQFVSFRP